MSLRIVSITASRQIRAALAHVKSHKDLVELDLQTGPLEHQLKNAQARLKTDPESEDLKQTVRQMSERLEKLRQERSEVLAKLTILAGPTCRALGCDKQKRASTNKKIGNRKGSRGEQVCCKTHSGLANMIPRKLRATLKSNPLLRIVPPAA